MLPKLFKNFKYSPNIAVFLFYIQYLMKTKCQQAEHHRIGIKAENAYDYLTTVIVNLSVKKSKKISKDQEPIQSDPTSYPQNQKGNN